MGTVTKEKELQLQMEDKVGLFAEVTGALAKEGINITALCAYGMEGRAYFMMLTSDNVKAKLTAESRGWQVKEQDVVVVELEDEVAAAQKVADKLKSAGLSLCYAYGTTCGCAQGSAAGCSSRLILCAADKADQIVAALNA